MNKIFLPLLIFTSLISCKTDTQDLLLDEQESKAVTSEYKSIPSPQETKSEIDSVLTTWHAAASTADGDTYFNLMTDDAIFIGTDATENWSLEEFKAFSKPYFDKGKAWSFTAVDRNVFLSNDGEVAWFDELLDTWMGACRGSGVLVQQDGIWKIKHYVLSIAVPNETVNQLLPLKQNIDRKLLDSLRL